MISNNRMRYISFRFLYYNIQELKLEPFHQNSRFQNLVLFPKSRSDLSLCTIYPANPVPDLTFTINSLKCSSQASLQTLFESSSPSLSSLLSHLQCHFLTSSTIPSLVLDLNHWPISSPMPRQVPRLLGFMPSYSKGIKWLIECWSFTL